MDQSLLLRAAVKQHYEKYVYPQFPLLSSIRLCDAYALNLEALWARFNGQKLSSGQQKILLAGCGSFSPYPTAMANRQADIIAVDLSKSNLDRAKLHTLLHRCFNVRFIEEDLTNLENHPGMENFHFIDCYGVLHHILNAVSVLHSMHAMLVKGGFIRLMVYSRGARRSAQAIRTAMRMIGIQQLEEIKKIYRKAPDGSRFKAFMDSAYEARFDFGIADMFLHPYAKTYTVNELLELLEQSGFEPLAFIHYGALHRVDDEIERLRDEEKNRRLYTNFSLLIGRKEDAERRADLVKLKEHQDTMIFLNPVIQGTLSPIPMISFRPEPKLGFENPTVNYHESLFLRKFKQPVKKSSLDSSQLSRIEKYLHAMFLVETEVI